MDSFIRKLQKNPRSSSNFVSRLLFSWTIPLFKRTYYKVLQVSDVTEPLTQDRSNLLGDRLERKWHEECKKNVKPSLVRAIILTFPFECIMMGILCFINDVVLRLILPFYLEHLLLYFRKNANVSRDDAFKNGIVIFFISVLSGISNLHYSYLGYCSGMKVRVAVSSLIYRKSLQLSQRALSDTAPGKLANLLSNDVSRFEVVSVVMHYLWISPIMTVIATYILWNEAKWAGILGLITVLSIVPIQSYTGKLLAMIRFKMALRIDERLRYMDEIISGVQVIKMYVWEKPFARLIAEVRQLETKQILKNGYIRALFVTFTLVMTRMSLFCTIAPAVLLYGREYVTVSKMFIISYLTTSISLIMSQRFVRGLSEIGEVLVALKRLQMFLEYEERDQPTKNIHTISADQLKSRNVALLMKNVSAGWLEAEKKSQKKRAKKIGSYKGVSNTNAGELRSFKLQDIDLEVPKGKLVFVIGPVGSGKSTFMQVLLKELPLICGSMGINGTISYACQESWIFTSTVRQNITFGQPMDRSRYDAVVQCTALKKDFAQLSDGDMTVVGENGTGLSGGQKARINLARAVYRKADIYLIDDPLSAVDSHVQSHLFNDCLGPNGFLARENATRILITHQVHFLKEADWVIVLKNGKIETQGDFNDISKSGVDVTGLMVNRESNINENTKTVENAKIVRYNSTKSLKKIINSTSSLNSEKSSYTENPNDPDEENELVEDLEVSSKETVKGSLLLNYLKFANRPCTLVFLFCSICLSQTLASMADIWVAYWIRQEELQIFNKKQMNATGSTSNSSKNYAMIWSTEIYMYIYSVIIILLFIFTLLRSVTVYKICAIASRNLHDAMFCGLISTKLRFFDTNPLGRIMNRFSKDMGNTDEALPRSLLDALQYSLMTIGVIIVIIFTNTKFSIVILILSIIFFLILRIYLKSSTNIKRIEGATKSPVFSHISATLGGLSTIRAFQAENLLQREFDSHQDLNTGTHFMFIGTFCGFAMSLDLMAYVFIACIIYISIFMNDGVTGDLVGLAITQTLRLTNILQFAVKQSAEVSNNLTSVERILEYTQLEPENTLKITQNTGEGWPSNGKIQFNDVFYRYSDDREPVLRGLSFIVYPREKISVVGRTGAGKSSLISSLFRLAIVEGEILIDGVNTSSIELDVLRSRISIIPQEPTLFSGTLRRNLDPFEENDDNDIWGALENVGMKELVSQCGGLIMPVSARGQNFSSGQRQILCLARAILRKNRIIVLDEATANVDLKTDEMIQRTIREKFADSTVITIAHRLYTVIDSDRVLVMDAGVAVEYDEPYVLLQNKESVFRDMVEALGPQEYEKLYAIAKEKFKNAKNACT